VEIERGYSKGKDTEVNKKGKYKQEKRSKLQEAKGSK